MQTKIIGGGAITPGMEWGIDPTFQAGRVSLRPYDYQLGGQVLGHYRVVGSTAAITPAANAVLFAVRWADPSRFMVLLRATFSTNIVTAVTAVRMDPVTLAVRRGYISNETTNILNLISASGPPSRARANMSKSLLTQAVSASAAAGISGGSFNADIAAGYVNQDRLTTAGISTVVTDFFFGEAPGTHPIVFSQNEGFGVSWGGTAIGAGTVICTLGITWAEVVTF